MLWEFKDSPITTWVTDSHCCSIDFAVLFDGIEREILWKQERSFDENTRTIWPLKMCKHTAMIRLYSFNQYVFFPWDILKKCICWSLWLFLRSHPLLRKDYIALTETFAEGLYTEAWAKWVCQCRSLSSICAGQTGNLLDLNRCTSGYCIFT